MKKWKKNLEMSSFYTCVSRITIIWCMFSKIWSATEIFFIILDYFLYFYQTNNLKNQNIEKLKKMLKDIIILLTCTKNHNMLYSSWDMACDRCNFYFLVRTIVCPFTPQKINIKKIKKTPGDNIILHISAKNYDQMMSGSWDMVCDGWADGRTDGHR